MRTAVLPSAKSGLVGAVILGLGRALGETMAIRMVIGNRAEISASLFAPSYTMANVIANEFTEAIVAGQDFTCALVRPATVGEIYCWGKNSLGVVPPGDSGSATPTPTKVAVPADAIELGEALSDTVCVRIPGSNLQCWGANTSGQVGNGSVSASSNTPTGVVGFP